MLLAFSWGGFGHKEEIQLGFDVSFLCRVYTSEPGSLQEFTGRGPWLFVLKCFGV